MKKTVTMSDIAKRFGVSNVTVSKALADKDGVSEELREKIKSAAVEMGYKLGNSKNGKDGKSKNVGVIIPARFFQPNGSFYWALYNKLVQELMKQDYYCIMEILDNESETEMRVPKMVAEKKIVGLIVLGQVNADYAQMISEKFSPLVFLDFYDKHLNVESIISDGYFGAYQLTDYLLEMGHTNIGFVGNISATSSIKDRFMGYVRAHVENNIPINKGWILEDRDENGLGITFKFPSKLPTAFVCNCDETAYRLIKQLKEKGVRVPDEVSVVGYDNYLISDICEPAITTIEVNVNEMASTTVEAIIGKISDENYSFGRKLVIGELIIKDSVKKIR